MKLTNAVLDCMDRSVLCWLATSSHDLFPNVSPKEIFTSYGNEYIIIANIASPQSERNLTQNEKVCVSFIDVLVQKGFQIKGNAEVIKKSSNEFSTLEIKLKAMTHGKFPFSSIFKIKVISIKEIIAPKYILYPNTTEAAQIENAKRAYRL